MRRAELVACLRSGGCPRLRPPRIVWVDLGIGDDVALPNDVAGRHWEFPTLLAIELGQVGPELSVDLA